MQDFYHMNIEDHARFPDALFNLGCNRIYILHPHIDFLPALYKAGVIVSRQNLLHPFGMRQIKRICALPRKSGWRGRVILKLAACVDVEDFIQPLDARRVELEFSRAI